MSVAEHVRPLTSVVSALTASRQKSLMVNVFANGNPQKNLTQMDFAITVFLLGVLLVLLDIIIPAVNAWILQPLYKMVYVLVPGKIYLMKMVTAMIAVL